jgi:SAM-dependent methyltransferase
MDEDQRIVTGRGRMVKEASARRKTWRRPRRGGRIPRLMDHRIRNEIAHGARTAGRAERLWNWSGPAGRRRWARRVAKLTGLIPEGARVLEVGCWNGLFTAELQGARCRATAPRVGSVDLVVGMSILHHLDLSRALGEFLRTLRPGAASSSPSRTC